ncbi:MAG TPA: SLC13 family permease [Trueperaceae bacterium]|nr:SLC13 family permease [Trueperaceae bacterium]HRP46308.1 SLC13 family permease [Trueperaceae bacterium]
MSGPTLTVFIILGVAIVLFVSDRVRIDVVALLVVLALTLSGVLSPQQALAGFSDALVIMIAGLFVVGFAIVNTGLAAAVGNALGRVAGKSEPRMIVAVMLATGLLSAFMSSTGTVAVMLPIVVSMAWRAKVSPSKLLLPVAFAALVGGMLTLIATPPNLVVSQTLEDAGRAPFGFFAFTPIGIVMLAVAILYMATLGRFLLPATAPTSPGARGETEGLVEVATRYGLPTRLGRLTLQSGSPLVGSSLREVRWPERLGVRVLAIDTEPEAVRAGVRSRRHLGRSKSLGPDTEFRVGDRILLQGSREALGAVAGLAASELLEVDVNGEDLVPANLGFAEVLLTPRSSWIGNSLAALRFRERFGVQVVALQRGGERVVEGSGAQRLAETRLRFGDTLLVQGALSAIDRLDGERLDAVVLSESGGERPAPKRRKAPLAVVILLLMLASMSAGWVAPVVAVLMAALALVVTGCLSMEEAYRSVQWQSVVLIAGMLPLASALEVTGGVQLVADVVVRVFGGSGPLVLLAGTYLVTAGLGQVMSNTATAVLMAPVALSAAAGLGVSPEGVLMMVALASASSFCTPMATPVNTLVVGPGQYRFMDFARVGLPLQLLMGVVGLVVVPLLFPL